MMKKLLLLMMLCVMHVCVWGQATHTVYKFTSTAQDHLYTTTDGETYTVATTAENDVCNQSYYILSQYAPTEAPAKAGVSSFKVTTYYVNIDGNYTCAFGQAYDEGKTYATASETLLGGDGLLSKLIDCYVFTNTGSNEKAYRKVGDVYEAVQVGDICNLDEDYYWDANPDRHNTGSDLKGWGMVTESKCFSSTDGIYVVENDAYVKLSSNKYVEGTAYYTVTFTDLTNEEETAMAENSSNFEITYFVTGLNSPSGLYYYNSSTASYIEVNNGDAFLGDDKYFKKEDSYALRTPAELATLGYATGTTKMYNCDVTESVDKKSITVAFKYYGGSWEGYYSMLDYINDCPDVLSNHENLIVVDIANNEGLGNDKDKMKNYLSPALNNVSGVTNVVLSDIFNNRAIDFDFSNLNNSDIKRIILPSADRENLDGITNSETTPVVFEIVTLNTSKVLVSSPAAGSLAELKDYHYYSDAINAAERQVYFGEIGANDIEWFDGVKVSQLDLSAINTSDEHLNDVKDALHVLTNNTIKYVVFPDLKVKPLDPLYTDFLANCPKVVAVGQYTSTDKTFTAYSKEAGKLSILTNMLADLTNSNASIENVKLSGNLNALDLNGGATVIDPETGHLGVYKTSYDNQGWTAKDGVTPVGSGALNGVQLHDVNLKDAYFEVPEDMTLSAFGIFDAEAGYPITVEMPTDSRMTVVPPCFMEKVRTFSTVCVPENYTTIKAGAFYQCGVSHINTTKNGEVLDYGETAWTLSSTLELIEEGAFWTNVTGGVTDVYALRYEPTTSVPVTVCQKNSFPSGMYYGWGGFAGNTAHPICRENYKNNSFYFTILHYPAGMPDVQRAKYTDITRQYSFFDETGATDDDGLLYRWPSMEQFYRAYNQAVAGVTWDAWWQSNQIIESYAAVHEWSGDQYIEQLPVDQGKAYKFNPTTDTSITYRSEDDETSGWKDGWWNPSIIYASTSAAQTSTVPYLSSPATSYDDLAAKYKYDMDNFAGWHQFVLVGSTNYEHIDDPDPDPYWDFAKYKDNDWYTICLPFSLTKAELTKIFGNPNYSGSDKYTYKFPDVRTLAGVTRNIPSKHVLIQLSDNLMKHKLLRESDGSPTMTTSGTKLVPVYSNDEVADNEIVIEADKPYFIKPILPQEEKDIANAGRRAIQYTKKDADVVANGHVPNVTIHVNARNANETKYLDWKDTESTDVPAQPYKYYFLGNYIPQIMPMHAYYLGVKDRKSTIFRNSKTTRSWTTYNCVMGAIANEKTSVSIKAHGVEGKLENSTVEFVNEDDFTFSRKDDGKGEHAAKASFLFEFTEEDGAGTSTGIMQMNESGSMTFIKDNSPIYGVNGQIVGNKLENLPKGVYIVNGKKFIK